jgi:hypothetical protein
MNSMFSHSRILAAAVTLAALAGCNAVEDVRSDPFIDSPPATVVLQGTVTGLSSKRSLVLSNNGLLSDSVTIVAPTPENTYVNDTFPVAFSFGARAVRDANGNPVPYNITITTQPYGAICAFAAGSVHSGVLSPESPPNIILDCNPNPAVARYNLDVILDPAFANAPGAKVQLRTEDAIYEQAVTPAHITAGRMTFAGKLFNANAAPGDGPLGVPTPPTGSPVFIWTVSASTTLGGTVNRCPVLRATNPSVTIPAVVGPPAIPARTYTANPTAHITAAGVAPEVRPCSFTISGAVHYSRPAEVNADPALASGLTLELRDLNGVKKGTATVAGGAFPVTTAPAQGPGIAFTFNNTDTPATTAFTSNPNADFQVVVTSHPTGQTCIVPDGGFVSLRSLVQLNPVAVTARGTLSSGTAVSATAAVAATTNAPVAGTRLVVFCRNKPLLADQLHGVYRLTKTVAQKITSTVTSVSPTVTTVASIPPTVISEWKPFDFTVQNTASNNILTFFEDGTFLYGTHHQTNQVEHGFYEYSATLKAITTGPSAAGAAPGRLRFTLHTDTHPSTVFPATFSSAEQAPAATAGFTATPGISALPGALTYTAATPPAHGIPNAPYATRHANMGNVVKTNATGSTPAKITATAGPFGGVAANNSSAFTGSGPVPAPPVPAPAAPAVLAVGATATVATQVDWELTEVASVNGEMTGGWISQDYRRFWTWDKASTYGFQAGVNGLPNLQSSCFVMENAVSPTGTYQRRSAQTLCFPINRPRDGQNYNGTTDARDVAWLGVTHVFGTGGAPAGTGSPTPAQNVVAGEYSTAGLFSRFPQYESRIPGGQTALDGRSPSPIIYHIAPAASFFAAAPAEYFPQPAAAFTTWCPSTSDILGIRATLNGLPFREPVYLCRTRAR